MKFRISSKDLIIFLIFIVLLLYLCGLAVTNITYFGAHGSFYGLNPFPAFTNYFGATMLLFIIFLVIIFTSVSKTVFERKKGLGFLIGEKEDKGYSRWSKEREIKNDEDIEVVDPKAVDSEFAGIPLINDGKRLWVDNGEYHNLVIGATGSGKSQTIVKPMVELLMKRGESMIITDPKGELYKTAGNYLRKRGYNVILLNFREPQNGNAWNPLTLPYQYYKEGNTDKATELLDDVALNILYDPNNKGEPFWEKSAADYFSGLALGLFQDAKEEEINLNSINYMSTIGEEKFAASNYIKEYFTMKGEDSNAYVFASNTINAPADTKGGILSVFRQKIRLFASRENLSEMLAYSDFDMRAIGKGKTAVFIIIHDEKTTYHGLATIFIKQCYETLIDQAQISGGKLPYRTNFILDEFANMPPLKDVTTMVTAARSRDIRFTFIIQNFAQLKSVYGNENAETIKGNCGNLVYLISTELAALEEISKMCGEVKSDDKDKTASTPLVTVTDLQKLKLFEAIIIRWRLSPFKTKYTPDFKMDWGHEKSECDYPVRQKKEVMKFDVKEFVKEKKRQNMMSNLDAKGSSNSFDSPFGGSPFGMPKDDSSLFGGFGGGNIDLDAMMRDIDKKIAELDAEEARKKEEMEKNKEGNNDAAKDSVTTDNKDDLLKDNTLSDLPGLPINDTKPLVESFSDLTSEEDKTSTIAEKVKDAVIDSEQEEKPRLESFNIFDDVVQNKPEVNINNDIPNIAVATSSPIDDNDDFEFGLPKVENADVIKPNIHGNNNVNIKTNDDSNNYNIYNTVPNIMDSLKDEVKSERDVEEETRKFVESVSKTDDKDKLADSNKKMNENLNIYSHSYQVEPDKNKKEEEQKKVEKAPDKPNVNIDAESVVIDDNVISDDEFFDDFFGDD